MKTATPTLIQKIYDRIGRRYDLFAVYEGEAKKLALELLNPQPGETILNAGVGTGKEHKTIKAGVSENGMAIGLDLSHNLAKYSLKRTKTPQVQANMVQIPLNSNSLDAIYCAFVFDLLSPQDISRTMQELKRVLKYNSRLVVSSLTSGEKGLSRIITSLWKALFRINPGLCAGCRPINIRPYLEKAGFEAAQEHFVTQMGICSQVVIAIPSISQE